MFNSSINADSSYWDLGNGVVTKEPKAILTYDTSGTYQVKLTVKSSDGHTASQIKTVKVLDRVLKKIVINKVYWDTIPNHIPNFNAVWPTTPTADIFVQIQQYNNGDSIVPYSGILYNSPILYKSPVVNNVSCNTNQTIEIPVANRVVIDKKLITSWSFTISLMATDKNGTTYSLLMNKASGVSYGIIKEDLANNEFKVNCNLFSALELDCDFE
ncbi:hypothetical protein FLA_1022 [Filimonas lacunae]|nr:hypothetical protein FLA_1022 [Filimonas lacunae]